MDDTVTEYGLLELGNLQSKKFGIENGLQSPDLNGQQRDTISDVQEDSSLRERSSLSSSTSGSVASATGTFSQYLPISLQRNRPGQGYVGINSTSSEPKDTSDSDRVSQFKIKVQSTYMTLEDDHEMQDSISIASENSNQGYQSASLSSVFASVSAVQTPVKSNNHHTKQNSKDWVTFDEAGGSLKNADSKPKTSAETSGTRIPLNPPEIPQRKGNVATDQSGNTPSPSFDLLSMGAEMLTEHLHRGSPLLQTNQDQAVPPIPERLMSPVRPQSASPQPKPFDIRLPPPTSVAPSNRRSQRNTPRQAKGNPAVKSPAGPPVPPRKDFELSAQVKTAARKLELTSSQWVQFEEKSTGDKQESEHITFTSPVEEQSAVKSPSPVLMNNVIEIYCANPPVPTCESGPGDGDMWRPTSPSSTTSSLRSSKKKKGGYLHLSDTDEEEKLKVPVEAGSCKVEIKVTDLSPSKPLSAWAPIRNEENAGSSGNVSMHNSIMDGVTPDDLDEDFADNANRLTGFNRADKGSQNNLVDFSESAEQLQNSESGSANSSLDGDMETIFDMSARGDSLKRRIRKKPEKSTTPTFQIGLADMSDRSSSAAEVALEFDPIGKSPVEQVEAQNLPPTNPFWCPSPVGDTASLASSTNEINPFENFKFQSSANTQTTNTKAAVKLSSGFPILPPPPSSSKIRGCSGSLRRSTRDSSVSSPVAHPPQEGGGEVFDSPCATPSILDSSFEQLSTVFVTPVKSPVKRHTSKDSSASPLALDLGIDVPDSKMDSLSKKSKEPSPSWDLAFGIEAPENQVDPQPSQAAPVSVDSVSVASTSKQGNILETTLSILDVFSKPVEETAPPPISLEDADVKTFHAVSIEPSFPELRDKSLDSLEKLQKSVESPVERFDEATTKNLPTFSDYDLVPQATEWKMLMRFPREKHVMSSRKWVSIYVRLDIRKVQRPNLQLYHNASTQDPFYFLPLAPHDWQITDPSLQARFYNSGSLEESDMEAVKRKVHAVKLLHIHYKEKHAFMSKQDQLMLKTPSGFKHSMKGKQAVKLGTENYTDLLSLLFAVRDAAFAANRLQICMKENEAEQLVGRQQLMNYHSRDEIVFNLRDQFRGVVSTEGKIEACCVRVHVFVTSFLSGDPLVTLTFNDKQVEGCEVVRREDIMPSSNDRWVELSDVDLHRSSAARGYDAKTASVIFRPPDACRFELMRFRCPYTETELPVSIKASIVVKGPRVSLRCVLRSGGGHSANKDPLTQVPCEDVAIRFYVPDTWAPAFRRPGRFRLRSVHAKRIVRRPPTVASAPGASGVVRSNAVLEASVGGAKYEVAYGAIVWRIGRFPEKNAALNTPQILSCKLELASERGFPDDARFRSCDVEYKMPSATASNACVRSVHLPKNAKADKFACYESHYMYKVGVSVTQERDEMGNSDQPNCAHQ